jgi:signal peptidase I
MHEKLGSTTNHDVLFIFRVIGLPGETVEIRNGFVYINGSILQEPYKTIQGGPDFPSITIPENEYFFLGDNRPDSWDSRFWDPATIKREDIYGKVAKILPGYYKDWKE